MPEHDVQFSETGLVRRWHGVTRFVDNGGITFGLDALANQFQQFRIDSCEQLLDQRLALGPAWVFSCLFGMRGRRVAAYGHGLELAQRSAECFGECRLVLEKGSGATTDHDRSLVVL
ncbi:hypothetical protein [Nocardia abscessus]|uniref:hypothetical protein n=1 Tax=Nocardia abscessus TaxID=120957 RepID=UPI002457B025|nr:hypothetical protein [Nocardia abscessus]